MLYVVDIHTSSLEERELTFLSYPPSYTKMLLFIFEISGYYCMFAVYMQMSEDWHSSKKLQGYQVQALVCDAWIYAKSSGIWCNLCAHSGRVPVERPMCKISFTIFVYGCGNTLVLEYMTMRRELDAASIELEEWDAFAIMMRSYSVASCETSRLTVSTRHKNFTIEDIIFYDHNLP